MLENINFPESKFFVAQSASTGGNADAQFDELITQALSNPVEFPTLDKFVLPGDVVALALMGNLPSPIELLEALVGRVAVVVEDANIIAVVSPVHRSKFDEATIQELTRKYPTVELQIVIHDPNDKGAVACIANNQEGEPVYVNRQMFDADVVIPFGALLDGSSLQSSSFYPEFSSQEVQDRFKKSSERSRKPLDGEIRLAEQNLGTEFSVLVAQGPGDSVASIKAGSSRCIREDVGADMESLWCVDCQAEGELVVATIESDPEQQTWDDVFKALAAAVASSQEVRQIVVCTQINCEPNSQQMEILQLQFEVDLDERCRKLGQLAGAQQVVPGVLESTSVYLLSELSQDVVEEAGLGFIESEDQIQKIVDRAESGILLRDAHRFRVAVNG